MLVRAIGKAALLVTTAMCAMACATQRGLIDRSSIAGVSPYTFWPPPSTSPALTPIAYSLNVTATAPWTPLGFLTLWPTGQALPLASTLNDPKGVPIANAAIAIPEESGQMVVHSSTQNPTEIQAIVTRVLQRQMAQVTCICRRMGGGFGGKETQAAIPAALAALVAAKPGRPARCVFGH